MTDADLLLTSPDAKFGSGVIGVCDICGKRQAVVVLDKERYKLCVIDFLNKKWVGSAARPGVAPPIYRSERVTFPTTTTRTGTAPAIVLSPTRVVRHPAVLITPDVHGLTTAILDGAIRLAHQGFEVLLPDTNLARAFHLPQLVTTRAGTLGRRGVPLRSPAIRKVTGLYLDALGFLRARPMVDPEKSAVVGLSFGGAFALGVGADDQKLSALVLAYPVPVDPPELFKLVTAPMLVIAGARDRRAARALAQATVNLPPERLEARTVAGVGHGFMARDLRAYDLAAAEGAWAQVGDFLARRLLPPPPRPPVPPTVSALPPKAPSPPPPGPATASAPSTS